MGDKDIKTLEGAIASSVATKETVKSETAIPSLPSFPATSSEPTFRDELIDRVTLNYHTRLGNNLVINGFTINVNEEYTYAEANKISQQSAYYISNIMHQNGIRPKRYEGHVALISGYTVVQLHKRPDSRRNYSLEQVAELLYTEIGTVNELISAEVLDRHPKQEGMVLGRSVRELFDLVHPVESLERYQHIIRLLDNQVRAQDSIIPADESLSTALPSIDALAREYQIKLKFTIQVGAYLIRTEDKFNISQATEISGVSEDRLLEHINRGELRSSHNGEINVSGYELIRFCIEPDPSLEYTIGEASRLFHTDQSRINRFIEEKVLVRSPTQNHITGVSLKRLFDLVYPMETTPRYGQVMGMMARTQAPDSQKPF